MQYIWTAEDIKPGVIVARCGFSSCDYSRIEIIGYCPKLRSKTGGANVYGVTDFSDGMFVSYESKAELAEALTKRNARPLSHTERVLLIARFDDITENWCSSGKRQ